MTCLFIESNLHTKLIVFKKKKKKTLEKNSSLTLLHILNSDKTQSKTSLRLTYSIPLVHKHEEFQINVSKASSKAERRVDHQLHEKITFKIESYSTHSNLTESQNSHLSPIISTVINCEAATWIRVYLLTQPQFHWSLLLMHFY